MNRVYIILIVLAAGLLRIIALGDIPAGIYCDEAANGYDAYSIAYTGRDMHGRWLPLLMNHHNVDYAGSLYTYGSVPSVWLFGLSPFSTRLLAALVGTLTVASTYALTATLFNKPTALLAALFVAVSPWHLHVSRIAFNAILVPFFTTTTLLLFLKALHKPHMLAAGAFVMALSLYSYAVMKVVVPLLLVVLALVYMQELAALITRNRNARLWLIASALLFVVLASPIFYLSLAGTANLRFEHISVFHTSDQPLLTFGINMLRHLSPNFLFVRGDVNLRHSIPGYGQLLPLHAPFILLVLAYVLYSLYTSRSPSPQPLSHQGRGASSSGGQRWATVVHTAPAEKKADTLLVCLVVIGIVPASLTNESIPHALRAIAAVPFLDIMAAAGLVLFVRLIGHLFISRKDAKTQRPDKRANSLFDYSPIVSIVIAIVITFEVVQMLAYLHAYFVSYPLVSQRVFDYGMQQSIAYTEQQRDTYDHIIFSSSICQPYIYPLFFSHRNLSAYQYTGTTPPYMTCPDDIHDCTDLAGHNLLVVKPDELPDAPVHHKIANEQQQTVIKMVKSGLSHQRTTDAAFPLVWLPSATWGTEEQTTDAHHRRFRWLTGQHGNIRLFSHRPAVIALSLHLRESVNTGNVRLVYDQQDVLSLTLQPQQPQQHTFWLLVQPGITTLTLHTDIVPVQDSNRTITLALEQPQVMHYAEVEHAMVTY